MVIGPRLNKAVRSGGPIKSRFTWVFNIMLSPVISWRSSLAGKFRHWWVIGPDDHRVPLKTDIDDVVLLL